jgi:hypothetical protein
MDMLILKKMVFKNFSCCEFLKYLYVRHILWTRRFFNQKELQARDLQKNSFAVQVESKTIAQFMVDAIKSIFEDLV